MRPLPPRSLHAVRVDDLPWRPAAMASGILERDIAAVPEKGSLYQHQCATCGGRVADTLDIACQYCGTALNSTRHEWIVCGFNAN